MPPLMKVLVRTLKAEPRNLRKVVTNLIRNGVPRELHWYMGGIGDEIMMTAIARMIRNETGRRSVVMAHHDELFLQNDDIECVYPTSLGTIAAMTSLGVRIRKLSYTRRDAKADRDSIPNGHIIPCAARSIRAKGRCEVRPRVVLTHEELMWGRQFENHICIQTDGRGGTGPMLTKQWISQRFQEVADSLASDFQLIQIGMRSDYPIAGAKDLRGKTTLRELGAVLANSRLFIGLVGMQMHLARAVNCRSVIIYGGRESPSQSGYICNENLYSHMWCSPCWRINHCPNGMACMQQIAVEDVLAAVNRQLARGGIDLEAEVFPIEYHRRDG